MLPLDFDFFEHPMFPYKLKEDLFTKFELNSSEKMTLCSVNMTATYKLSGISF